MSKHVIIGFIALMVITLLLIPVNAYSGNQTDSNLTTNTTGINVVINNITANTTVNVTPVITPIVTTTQNLTVTNTTTNTTVRNATANTTAPNYIINTTVNTTSNSTSAVITTVPTSNATIDYGYLYITVSGARLMSLDIVYWDNATPDNKITTSVHPDGKLDLTLPVGDYIIEIPDGNAGQPEYAHATVVANQVSYMDHMFLGHSSSSSSHNVCTDSVKIVSAEYCGVTIPAVTHTVHHDAVAEIPAWIEHFGSYNYIPAHFDTHHRWVLAQYEYVGIGNGDYNKVEQTICDHFNSNHNCDHLPTEYLYKYIAPVKHAEIPAVKAYDEVVIDTPAITGSCASVTDYFTEKLNKNTVSVTDTTGSTNDWKWLNSFQAYDNSFTDPAYGIEKGINVIYTVCNGEQKTLQIPNVNNAGTTITLS
jgi:hypothetical protein